MNPLVMIAATVIPELLRKLAQDREGQVQQKVEAVVTEVTGATTAAEAKRSIDTSPQVSAELRRRLTEIAFEERMLDLEAENVAVDSDLDYNELQVNSANDARRLLVDISDTSKIASYTPQLLSYVIVICFFGLLWYAANGALKELRPEALQVTNLLFGALTAGFATVLNYWFGSSLGSRRKDAIAAATDSVQQIKRVGGSAVQFVQRSDQGRASGATASRVPVSNLNWSQAPIEPGSEDNLSEEDDRDDVDEDTARTSLARLAASPKQVPERDPVPFAQSRTPINSRHWPVKTDLTSAHLVSYETVNREMIGAPGRRFLASRNGGKRLHVGLDLYANRHDEVVACEDGRIVAFYSFYKTSKGDMSYALLIEHSDIVINYGEVAENSQVKYGWSVGDRVQAGQAIGTISGTAMLHFETYRLGTRANSRWLPGQPRPVTLLNPTLYLLEIAARP